MAARHLAKDFLDEQEDDYGSAYATANKGKHLRNPGVRYVPTVPLTSAGGPVRANAQADKRAREHVEELFRELDLESSNVRSAYLQTGRRFGGTQPQRPSNDTLPGFGPPQSMLSDFVPSVDAVPDDWNSTASEGVFSRNTSKSETMVLDQASLHGLRRRLDGRKQVELARRNDPRGISFGYYPPYDSEGSSESPDSSGQRKGFVTVVAEFFARLFNGGKR